MTSEMRAEITTITQMVAARMRSSGILSIQRRVTPSLPGLRPAWQRRKLTDTMSSSAHTPSSTGAVMR